MVREVVLSFYFFNSSFAFLIILNTNLVPSLLDTSHDIIFLKYSSITLDRYRKPEDVHLYVMSVTHTSFLHSRLKFLFNISLNSCSISLTDEVLYFFIHIAFIPSSCIYLLTIFLLISQPFFLSFSVIFGATYIFFEPCKSSISFPVFFILYLLFETYSL